MVEKSRLKITVLKKTDTKQIFGDKPPMGQAIDACSRFEVGQEFIVEEDGSAGRILSVGLERPIQSGSHVEVWWKLSMDERERNLSLLLHRRTKTSNLRNQKN